METIQADHLPEQAERMNSEDDSNRPSRIEDAKVAGTEPCAPVAPERLSEKPAATAVAARVEGRENAGRLEQSSRVRITSSASDTSNNQFNSEQQTQAESPIFRSGELAPLETSPLLALQPSAAGQANSKPLYESAPQAHVLGLQAWSSFELESEIPGRQKAKARRQLRRKHRNPKDDTDYEPGLRVHRARKHISRGPKHKPPGRTRLTLAGVASTIGDIHPGWRTPHGSVVLVAKTLTKSDTLGRVILPRVAVETNMSFLTAYRAYTLAVRDPDERPWEFVVKSWANGSEQRRVYVLEQASLYLRSNHLHEGDIIGICCDEEGNLRVAANTQQLREAVLKPNYGIDFGKPAASQMQGNPAAAEGSACTRTPFYDKQLARAGFCSGPRESRRQCCKAGEAAKKPVYLRPKRSCEILDGVACKTVTSMPLTDEDIANGLSRMPATFQEDPIGWPSMRVTVKDDSGQAWSLSLGNGGAHDLVLLAPLEDFYKQQAARPGDSLQVVTLGDGSMLLHLDPSADSLPRTARGSGQDRKRKAASGSAEASLLPIKCGPLTGRLDLQQGSVRLYSDFSELSAMTSFTVSDFQAQAGFDAEDNWLQTIQIDADPSHTTLEQWLHDNRIRTESLERLCSSFQPASAQEYEPQPHHRAPRSKTGWPKAGRQASDASRGGWVGCKLADGTTPSREDSIAAAVLMSLSEPHSRISTGSAELNSEERIATESAARQAAQEGIRTAQGAQYY